MQPTTSPSPLPTDDELADVLDRTPARLRRRRWLIGLVVVASLAVTAALLIRPWLSGDEATWLTEPARVEDLSVIVSAVGSVEPRLLVEVGSEQSGVVQDVLVEPNDRVKVGDILATLDTRTLTAQDREAHAQVASAVASLGTARVVERSAETELKRGRQLAASGAIASGQIDDLLASLDQARTQRASAEAQVQAARARLALTDTGLRKATLRAPISGVVLTRDVDVGQSVVASLQAVTLFEIAEDLTDLRVEVDVDEADIPRVEVGQPATLTVPAWTDRTFPATVLRVHQAPDRTNGVVTYQADLQASNPDGALWVGMTATARIEAERLVGALTVPMAALRFAPPELPDDLPVASSGEGRVWVIVDGQPSPRLVRLGPSDGDRQAVLSGLQTDEAVVIGREIAP